MAPRSRCFLAQLVNALRCRRLDGPTQPLLHGRSIVVIADRIDIADSTALHSHCCAPRTNGPGHPHAGRRFNGSAQPLPRTILPTCDVVLWVLLQIRRHCTAACQRSVARTDGGTVTVAGSTALHSHCPRATRAITVAGSTALHSHCGRCRRLAGRRMGLSHVRWPCAAATATVIRRRSQVQRPCAAATARRRPTGRAAPRGVAGSTAPRSRCRQALDTLGHHCSLCRRFDGPAQPLAASISIVSDGKFIRVAGSTALHWRYRDARTEVAGSTALRSRCCTAAA